MINDQAESQDELLHWVAVDDRAGARNAAAYLLQTGHRAIAYVGMSSRPRSNRQRLLGYQDALVASAELAPFLWTFETQASLHRVFTGE